METPPNRWKSKGRAASRLFEESVEDMFFCFLLSQTECHEFEELVACNFTDGGLMNELCIDAVRADSGNGGDFGISHDNGVALDVTEAFGVTCHAGEEGLRGVILTDGAGEDSCGRILAVEEDIDLRFRGLRAMCEQTFRENDLSVFADMDLGVAVGGVDAADLGHIHFHGSAFFEVDDSFGVHDAAAGAVALAVVLFDVFDMGIFPDVEGMDAAVGAVLIAAVMDPAASDDDDIRVFADKEFIADGFVDAAFGEDDGDIF